MMAAFLEGSGGNAVDVSNLIDELEKRDVHQHCMAGYCLFIMKV